MKLLLSMLFMGIVSSGSGAVQAATARFERKPRRRSDTETDDALSRAAFDRALTAPDLGFVRAPALQETSERDLTRAILQRYTLAQSRLGRAWLDLRVNLQCLRAGWLANYTEVCKRAIDVLGSLAALIALSPLFLLIAILVKLEDGGPVFFAQTRVGLLGNEFKMYKVRSMCLDAEARLQELLGKNQHTEGVTFKLKNDPRITRVGRWLRKFSLDELPQLYNVLKGDMSMVGPRPPVPREVAKYSLADRRRLAVKPGITCIWQVSGRSEIDFSGQVQLDVDYIEGQNLWLDLKLLTLTLPAVISGRGAC